MSYAAGIVYLAGCCVRLLAAGGTATAPAIEPIAANPCGHNRAAIGAQPADHDRLRHGTPY